MKNLTLIVATLLFTLVLPNNVFAKEEKDIQIIRATTSSEGHTVYVGEYEENGIKTTHLSLSFENKICIKGLMKFDGANEKVKLFWVTGNQLTIKVPYTNKRFIEFPKGYLQCESQRVDIHLEEYRFKKESEDDKTSS